MSGIDVSTAGGAQAALGTIETLINTAIDAAKRALDSASWALVAS